MVMLIDDSSCKISVNVSKISEASAYMKVSHHWPAPNVKLTNDRWKEANASAAKKMSEFRNEPAKAAMQTHIQARDMRAKRAETQSANAQRELDRRIAAGGAEKYDSPEAREEREKMTQLKKLKKPYRQKACTAFGITYSEQHKIADLDAHLITKPLEAIKAVVSQLNALQTKEMKKTRLDKAAAAAALTAVAPPQV